MTTTVLLGVATGGLFVKPQDPIGGISIGVALVDGQTGDLLWANIAGDSKFGFTPPTFDRALLQPLVKTIFKSLPK